MDQDAGRGKGSTEEALFRYGLDHMVSIVDFAGNESGSLASPRHCGHRETVAMKANINCSPDTSKTVNGEWNVNLKNVKHNGQA